MWYVGIPCLDLDEIHCQSWVSYYLKHNITGIYRVSKYIFEFVVEYRHFVNFVFEITKVHVFVFDNLVCILKYLQIQLNIFVLSIKGKALPDTVWLAQDSRRNDIHAVVGSVVGTGHAALRKLAYNEAAGQRLASVKWIGNEWLWQWDLSPSRSIKQVLTRNLLQRIPLSPSV